MYIHQLLNNLLTPVIIQTDPPSAEVPRIQSPVVKLFFKVANTAERIVSNPFNNPKVVQNNQRLLPNNNAQTLDTEKNFNYLFKYLLAIALITDYFFNGGLKRKPFFLFTGTLLLLKTLNHYTYNRANNKSPYQALIHDLALFTLCYSAALVKPKHVCHIKNAAEVYVATCLISKGIQQLSRNTFVILRKLEEFLLQFV